MWVRKSEVGIQLVEISKEQRRKNLWRPLVAAVAVMAVVGLLYTLGFRAYFRGLFILSTSRTKFDSLNIAAVVIIFLIVFGAAVYRQRKHGGLFTSDDVFLCRDCKEPHHANLEMRQCGGQLEPIDYFDWIPESETVAASE